MAKVVDPKIKEVDRAFGCQIFYWAEPDWDEPGLFGPEFQVDRTFLSSIFTGQDLFCQKLQC